MLAFTMVGQGVRDKEKKPNFSTLLCRRFECGHLTIKGQEISSELNSGEKVRSIGPEDSEAFLDVLIQNDVYPDYEPVSDGGFLALATTALPVILIFIFFLLIMRQIQSGGGKAMSFGKSRARLLSETGKKITFEDVAGVEEAKEELEEVIQFLQDPQRFTRLGGRIPKGVLLMGPPGPGKTLLARAVAGEAGVPFFSISGSDFVEMFVGVGAVRPDLFEQGKSKHHASFRRRNRRGRSPSSRHGRRS